MNREQDVMKALAGVLSSPGHVKDLNISEAGDVSFSIAPPGSPSPANEKLKKLCEDAVGRLPWVQSVLVMLAAQPRQGANPLVSTSPGLAKVTNILAVSSCKGGVGKSTVAVNLAFTLSRMGNKVGIFDADVYGPSLPTMVTPDNTDVYADDDMIVPLEFEGVKLMSFGFVSGPSGNGGGPAIMRGPMVTQVINQLLTTTKWGELDYLVIDFPPGTGDIQLTLLQLIPLTAAVIVTTPQQLSFVDVVKGIQMFDKLKVPTIAAVENMSYYVCESCGAKKYLFGRGAREKLIAQFGMTYSFEVPIRPEISAHGDSGRPFVLEPNAKDINDIYRKIGDAVTSEIARLKAGNVARPKVAYAAGRGIVVTLADGTEKIVNAAALRRKCRCALCIEEMSGRPLLKPEDVSEHVYPTAFQPMGNYAVAIQWSDGHNTSIYPYDSILVLAI